GAAPLGSASGWPLRPCRGGGAGRALAAGQANRPGTRTCAAESATGPRDGDGLQQTCTAVVQILPKGGGATGSRDGLQLAVVPRQRPSEGARGVTSRQPPFPPY